MTIFSRKEKRIKRFKKFSRSKLKGRQKSGGLNGGNLGARKIVTVCGLSFWIQ